MAVEKAPRSASPVERVLEEALALSAEERKIVLAALNNSLESHDGGGVPSEAWEAAWSAELKRRVDNLEAGRTRLHSHDEVMAELDDMLRQP